MLLSVHCAGRLRACVAGRSSRGLPPILFELDQPSQHTRRSSQREAPAITTYSSQCVSRLLLCCNGSCLNVVHCVEASQRCDAGTNDALSINPWYSYVSTEQKYEIYYSLRHEKTYSGVTMAECQVCSAVTVGWEAPHFCRPPAFLAATAISAGHPGL